MTIIYIMWVMLAAMAVTCAMLVNSFGWEASLQFVKENADAIKLTLAVIAAVYTAWVFYVEIRDKRIANTLAFQEKADTGHLREAFETIDMFWIRGDGKKFLEDFRKVEKTKDIDKINRANDSLADKAWKSARNEEHEEEIFAIFDFYRDIVVCVEQDRCDELTACQLFANQIENFRELNSEFIHEWEKLWGRDLTGTLIDFYSDCGDDRIIGGQRYGLKEKSFLSADVMS